MHRKCFLIVALVTLVFASAAIFAQTSGRISGKVFDKETGEPLVGANVVVVGTNYGAATNIDGEYMVLNVPVGIYTVKAMYMGYADYIISNIKVRIGLTYRQDFALSSKAIQAEAVQVTAERPMIEKTSTNASRIIDGEDMKNLPVRGVNAVATLQPGIVAQDNNIYIRGGRADEVETYVDGASIRDVVSGNTRGQVIPEALEEMQIQAGGYSAKYGGANSGIVAMAIRAGSPNYKFSLRAETDNFAKYGEKFLDTYTYGYSDYTFTASGPVPKLKNFRFFFAGRNTFTRDNTPRFWSPFEIVNGKTVLPDGSVIKLADTGIRGGKVGEEVDRIDMYGVHKNGRARNPFYYNSVITGDFKSIKFRFSGIGTYSAYTSGADGFYNQFTTARFQENQYSDGTYTGKITHVLSPKTYYEVSASYYDARGKAWDPDFKDNVWAYQDSVANKALGWQYQKYTWGPRNYDFNGFGFDRPGTRQGWYSYWKRNYISGKLDFTHQFKHNQIEFGGEFKYWTLRNFSFIGNLTYLRNTPDVAMDKDKFLTWARTVSQNVYGYDRLGNELNDDTYPWNNAKHPTIGSAYIQDRYEYKDLVINAGLRYDYYSMDQWEPNDYANPQIDAKTATLVKKDWHEVKAFQTVSPRLGFSFPVSDNTTFHVQWGKFVQMPQMSQAYRSMSTIFGVMHGGYFYTNPTALSTRPERTTQYEVGIGQMLGSSASFDATVFYKDIKDQLQTRRIFTASDAEVTTYDVTKNGDFATTKGFELRLTLRRTNRVQGWLNYTYADARGTGSYQNQASASLDQATSQMTLISPLYFNQKHTGSLTVDYRFAKGDGGPVLERAGLNVMFTFSSGHPYTLSTGGAGQNNATQGATLPDTDARSRSPLEPIGASITPWQFNLDARLDKTFTIGKFDINVYVYAQNVLNTKNVINVYPRTGSDVDGFLNDPNLSSKVIASQGGAGYAYMYHLFNDLNRLHYWGQFNGSDLWSTPRRIRAGIMINFQ
ncbi:TonB-dependent receptor [bacterium]|nr:TonB-dependent receptor [bacterium]